MKKKIVKIAKITSGVIIGSGIIFLAYIGLGEILVENYYDPGRGLQDSFNSSKRGYGLTVSLFRK